jgi:hypothetical protein
MKSINDGLRIEGRERAEWDAAGIASVVLALVRARLAEASEDDDKPKPTGKAAA